MSIFEIAKALIKDIYQIYPKHADMISSALGTLECVSCAADGVGKQAAFDVFDVILDHCLKECPKCVVEIEAIKKLVEMGKTLKCGGP